MRNYHLSQGNHVYKCPSLSNTVTYKGDHVIAGAAFTRQIVWGLVSWPPKSENRIVPLHSSSYSCPECCNTTDSFGDHQVGCGGNGNRVTCHNAIHDKVFSDAQSADLAPSKEIPNLTLDSLSRPADVFLSTWSCCWPADLDILWYLLSSWSITVHMITPYMYYCKLPLWNVSY